MKPAHPSLRHVVQLFAGLLIASAALAIALASTCARAALPDSASADWKRLDQLIDGEKFAAAAQLAGELRDRAMAAGDEASAARALIREAELRVALGGYAAAVQRLMEAERPTSPEWRAAIGLAQASALTRYLWAYRHDIDRRERIAADGDRPIETWTRGELRAAIDRAFAEVWRDRERIAALSFEHFGEVVERNDYPEKIRPTPRDALTYLWAEALTDRDAWRSEERASAFELNVEDLLRPGPALAQAELLTGEAIHPLLKAGALLADLADWHLARGEREAALEALRVRMNALVPALNAPQRDLVIADFEKQLEVFSDEPWWSMGIASLANQLMARDRPDDLIRALALSRAGRERFPDSAGAQHCEAAIRAIEAPRFDFSAMAVDGPRKRSIEIEHANLKEIFFRAYPVDLMALRTGAGHSAGGFSEAMQRALLTSQPSAAWSVRLTDAGDHRPHRTFIVPPIDASGGYFIVASMRADFDPQTARLQGQPLLISRLAIVADRDARTRRARVIDAQSGAPVPGASVEIYRRDRWDAPYRRTATLTTDLAGEVALGPGADGDKTRADDRQAARAIGRGEYLLVAHKDGEVTFDITPAHGARPLRANPGDADNRALIYTDRSIYRPGQTISWKVVPYRGSRQAARFSTMRGARLEVALVDANDQRVALKKVKSDAFGAASGTFEIPPGRALGSWRIRASLNPPKKGSAWLGQAEVRVEEYRRPTFEVAIDPDLGAASINAPVRVSGSARTYYGTAVNAGAARWTVERREFGPARFPWPPPHHGAPQIVASGTAALDAEGRFLFDFTPRADPEEARAWPERKYAFTVRVEVTDQGGEARAASRALRLGWRTVDATLALPAGFLDAGKGAELSALRTDLDGTPRPGAGRFWVVRLALPKIAPAPADLPRPLSPERDARFALPGDVTRSRTSPGYSMEEALAIQPEGERVAEGLVAHDARGIGKIALPGLDSGAYRLHYETEDARGQLVHRQRDFAVAAPSPDLALPALLIADRAEARVGESVRLFVHSGRPNQRMLLEVFRGGERISRRWLVAGADKSLREIPIREEDRGGLTVRLTAVMDWQLVVLGADIAVPFDDRALAIEWEHLRDRVQPGAREHLRLKVRRRDGRRLDARSVELFAYAYDRSLEALAPHAPINPLDLLPDRRGMPAPTANLMHRPPIAHWGARARPPAPARHFSPDALRTLDGHGVGGMGLNALGLRKGRVGAVPMSSMAAPAAGAPDQMAMAENAAPDQAEAEALADAGAAALPGLVQPRADFRETAFWMPSVAMNRDGSATVEFTVPDALTSWRVFAVALTRQLHAGLAERTFESARDLMVRPRLPRFLREGDRAELCVTVDSSSAAPLQGEVAIELADPATGQDLLARYGLDAAAARASFELADGKSQTLTFPIRVPAGVGEVEVKATARTLDSALSDGELRTLPILPSRAHLSRSRFAALRGNERRSLSFEVNAGDASLVSEALVVTLDAQLLDGALAALPYLVRHPYQSSEQALSRLVSTSIVAGLFEHFPSLGRRARQMAAQRTARLSAFDQLDPNRRLSLEETPWLQEARGGSEAGDLAIALLDPEVARAEREAALRQLRKAQDRGGGFAWWPGGKPSAHMTIHVLAGLARGAEFGAEIPEDIAVRAWRYLKAWYGREIDAWLSQPSDKGAADIALVTYLNYVASAFDDSRFAAVLPDRAARDKLLDFSFARRRELSPMSKGQLALTLKRMGRGEDARMVFESVMDSATTTADEGTFWQPEEKSWLWYRDTVESHAFALRVLTELSPEDPRRAGLVQWLFLNRKLSHWKSTRATAEAIYALAHNARSERQLDQVERARVTLGQVRHDLVFSPAPKKLGTGQRQLSLAAEAIDARALGAIVVEQETPGLMFASATWHFSTEDAAVAAAGDLFSVTRTYFRRTARGNERILEPLAEGARLRVGDEVEVQLKITARHGAEYVHLRDPRAAGLEPVNARSGYRFDQGLACRQEVRDSATNLFFDWLPAGEFTFRYRLKAAMAGEFRTLPATLQSMYAPEFTAHSGSAQLAVDP